MFCVKGGGNRRQIVNYRDFPVAPAAFGTRPEVIALYGKPAVNDCAPSCFERRNAATARVGLEQFATAVFLPQIHAN